MSEFLNAYNSNGQIVKTQERKSLLKEIRDFSKENGDAELAVDCIHVLLRDTQGRLAIVQRADKAENPFLFDKTVGGHVVAGDSFHATLRKEMGEELGIQAVVASDAIEYQSLIQATDLTKIAVVRLIDFNPWQTSKRLERDGSFWVKRNNAAVYSGVYDGEVSFEDGEAQDIMRVTYEEICKQLEESPEKFTDDLGMLLRKYQIFLS